MSKTKNKESYFFHRNSIRANRDDRDILGEREVRTLLSMLDAESSPDFLAGKLVVDLGCGDQYIRKAVEGRAASYRGIDIDECNLEIESLPLNDQSADIAICLALLEHLSDPGFFLAEINRCLKPGGVLWLSTPDIQACREKFWNDPTHVHPYTRSSLRVLLEMNAFEDVLVTPNYRCKPKSYYVDSAFNFFRARFLMPFAGTGRPFIPKFLKGHCTGLFALARTRSVGSMSNFKNEVIGKVLT